MATHLLDEVEDVFGHFDPYNPRDCQARLMKLEFFAPLFEPRRAELHDAMIRFSSLGDISIGLVFWLPIHRNWRTPEESFQRLAACGVGQADRWSLRAGTASEDPEVRYQFYSQSIESLAHAAEPLSQLVVRMDHGLWDRISASPWVWSRAGALLRFWDDRGADILCRDVSVVNSCRELFLEYEA